MRLAFAPFLWLGRMLLWVLVLPVGIWRSLRHHRKKGERRTVKKTEKRMQAMLDERDRDRSSGT